MHVETYNIKYRAQECQDVKEEPGMYLGEENQVYVQGGYQPVFDMSPQSQSQQHCDQQFAYTIRWETARPVQEIHYTSYFTPSYSGSSSEALKYSHHLPSSGDYRHGELEHTNYTGNQHPPPLPPCSWCCHSCRWRSDWTAGAPHSPPALHQHLLLLLLPLLLLLRLPLPAHRGVQQVRDL